MMRTTPRVCEDTSRSCDDDDDDDASLGVYYGCGDDDEDVVAADDALWKKAFRTDDDDDDDDDEEETPGKNVFQRWWRRYEDEYAIRERVRALFVEVRDGVMNDDDDDDDDEDDDDNDDDSHPGYPNPPPHLITPRKKTRSDAGILT